MPFSLKPSHLRKYFTVLELEVEDPHLDTRWINADLRPIEVPRRTWGFWAYHNFWALGGFNVSQFMTGSSLIALGLNWWQALISILIGSTIASCLVALNCVMGARYHIGFPVSNRCVWGMYGSFFPILNRILLSVVWFGFQAWIGGECVYVCLFSLDPRLEQHIPNHMAASMDVTSAQFLSYWLFMIVSLALIWIRPHRLTPLLAVSATISIIFMVVLFIWALASMGKGGFGDIISHPSQGQAKNFGWLMAYGIISSIGSLSVGILNVNDYARFAKRPRDPVLGQGIAIAVYATLGALIGILVTAATEKRFGQPLWNLPSLFEALIAQGGSGARAASFFAGLCLIIAQIGLNVPGNALSGGFDMASVLPRYVNIRRGAYLTAILSIAANPWKLVTQATTFIAVLGGYSVFTSPMIGVMIGAYWIVNRQKLKVNDLYIPANSSIYWYTAGINWRAPVAWIMGVWPFLPGFAANVNPKLQISPPWVDLYYISFILGFCISVVVYVGLHYCFPDVKQMSFAQDWQSAGEIVRSCEDEWTAGVVEGRPVAVDDVEQGPERPESSKKPKQDPWD